MKEEISFEHKTRFEEIKKELTALGSKEDNFVKVEILFFEAISIAREYGDDIERNDLLSLLKELQAGSYHNTNEHFKKSSQRVQVIRRFANQFRIVLSTAIKNFKAKNVVQATKQE